MSHRSAIQLELYEQCHSPFTVISVLIKSRRLLIWVRSKVVALRSIARKAYYSKVIFNA